MACLFIAAIVEYFGVSLCDQVRGSMITMFLPQQFGKMRADIGGREYAGQLGFTQHDYTTQVPFRHRVEHTIHRVVNIGADGAFRTDIVDYLFTARSGGAV